MHYIYIYIINHNNDNNDNTEVLPRFVELIMELSMTS